MNRCGNNGSEASLDLPPENKLFNHISRPKLLSDPVLLDGAGQAIGIWVAHTLKTDFVIFPVSMEDVRFYTTAPDSSGTVTCLARSSMEKDDTILSDVYLVNPDGTLRAQLKGLKHKRIHMSDKFHEFRGSRKNMFSAPWEIHGVRPDPFRNMICRLFDPASMDFESADGRVMRTALAYIVLSRRERLEWGRLQKTGKRGTEWLLGRVAVKEAVRMLLKRDSGLDVWPADIEIIKDNNGRPVADGNWVSRTGIRPCISLSHCRGKAVALAAGGSEGLGVGVDMEHFNLERINFEKVALTKEERDMISSLEEMDSTEGTFRIWCAKEAIGKALGVGILNRLGDLVLRNLETRTERMDFKVEGELAKDFPELVGKPVTAHTFRDGDFIYAVAVYKTSVHT